VCVISHPPGPGSCDDGLYTSVTADSLGGFTSSLTVAASIYVPSLGVEVDCTDPSNPCVLGAADGADVVGTGVATPLRFAAVVTVPGAPTIGTAVSGNAAATVSWAAPASNGGSPITGYVVTPYVGGVAQPSQTFLSAALSQSVTGLTNGTAYTFTVAAMNVAGTGAESTASGAVLVGAPGAPAPASAVAGPLSATVSWTVPADNGSPITGYTVFVGIPGSFAPAQVVNVGPGVTTTTISGLVAGQEHFLRVAAINAVGTGLFARSPGRVTIEDVGVPDAPAPASAAAGSLSATVSWTVPDDNGSPITGYTVFVGVPGSYAPERVVNVGPEVTSLVISGLIAGQEHFFRVAAINAVGTGPYARTPGRVTIGA